MVALAIVRFDICMALFLPDRQITHGSRRGVFEDLYLKNS